MDDIITIDLFVEDHAHELFLDALVRRLAHDEGLDIEIYTRSARGGHGRALDELDNYRKLLEKGLTRLPTIIIVAIDANCKDFQQAHNEIEKHLTGHLQNRTIIACPDPHIERWYIADPVSFCDTIGSQPRIERIKCQRGRYKRILAEAIQSAGHISTLGGIEFALEIVQAMDLYRVSKAEPSLGIFITDLHTLLKRPV
jgi:hypothetical protein